MADIPITLTIADYARVMPLAPTIAIVQGGARRAG